MQIGTGVDISAINVNYGQGTITSTGGSSDMAIAGNGYFTVIDPSNNATYVTRAGDFSVNSSGDLVTASGQYVQGVNSGTPTVTASVVNGALSYAVTNSANSSVGNLKIGFSATGNIVGDGTTLQIGTTNDATTTPPTYTLAYLTANAPAMSSYAVDSSGTVNITLSNGTSYNAGSVLIQNFSDPEALESVGNNCYANMAAAGPQSATLSAANNTAGTNGLGTIVGQSLESSNVDLSAEMTNLITAQRSFEAGSKIITTSDSVLQTIVNLKQQ
jgi:flagellar hook protein FlgE